mmetsp:Transcript_61574/g.109554  ORF Transcript_61574/g.109554 Transcript_61574/m.109554 type:complete len:242 (-) Transcript_61574:130-855(-)
MASSPTSPKMRLSPCSSSGTLRQTGQNSLAKLDGSDASVPKIARYLSVNSLSTRRKLAKSTGNVHGYMAEDYKQLNWPLPKSFGQEKYGFSLIDIEDPRFLKENASNSKKLIRLNYDRQIVDLEWRKTYKAFQNAEHRLAALGVNAAEKTKTLLKKEVDGYLKYLLELQEQKDIYDEEKDKVYGRCDEMKGTIKKENDLEELRMDLESSTKDRIPPEASFWRQKFNSRSANIAKSSAAMDR